MIYFVPILCGIGCVLTIGAASFSKNRANFLAAIGLLGMWSAMNVMWLYDKWELFPALDWIVGIGALLWSMHQPEKWSRMVFIICYLRLAMHVVDQLSNHVYRVPYAWGLAGLFLWLLWVVAEPGGRNGLCRFLDFWRRSHLHHPPVAARTKARRT